MNDTHDDQTPRTDRLPPEDGPTPTGPSGPGDPASAGAGVGGAGGASGDGYGPDGHPDLEEVAAFVEGGLSGDARRRMVLHLAACEDCHELMTETTELLRPDEESAGEAAAEAGAADTDARGKLLRPSPGRWRRTFPLIAAAAAAVLAAVLVWTPAGHDFRRGMRDAASGPYDGDPVPVAEMVAPLPEGDPRLREALGEVTEHEGWPRFRGEATASSEPEALAFRLGVRNAELATALAALRTDGDHRDVARSLTARIQALLEGDPEAPYPVVDAIFAGPWLELRQAIDEGAPPEELIALHARADRFLGPDPELDSPGAVDAARYALGKWAGAALLAARAGNLEWFLADEPHSLVLRLDRVQWPASVEEPLAAIREVLRDRPSEEDLPLLREHLVELIAAAGTGRQG